MRIDLEQSLILNHIELSMLSPFQRILLTTDGTVTDILEAYFLEKIEVEKLYEQLTSLKQDMSTLDLLEGTEIIQRKILLKGKNSRKNFIFAESLIILDRLADRFKENLLKTKRPIGQIWLEQKVETFKEIFSSGVEPANELAVHFEIAPEANLLFRTYRVFSNQQLTMIITEKFPANAFREKF